MSLLPKTRYENIRSSPLRNVHHNGTQRGFRFANACPISPNEKENDKKEDKNEEEIGTTYPSHCIYRPFVERGK